MDHITKSDKGMQLNTCGVTASIFQIHQHRSWWAKIRKAINEVSSKVFWRVTLPNSGSGQLKRMFHLLTSQVSFRKILIHPFNN